MPRTGAARSNTPGDKLEAVVIMVRDVHAEAAFRAYAEHCRGEGDDETARELDGLADRAGPNSPFCKFPD